MKVLTAYFILFVYVADNNHMGLYSQHKSLSLNPQFDQVRQLQGLSHVSKQAVGLNKGLILLELLKIAFRPQKASSFPRSEDIHPPGSGTPHKTVYLLSIASVLHFPRSHDHRRRKSFQNFVVFLSGGSGLRSAQRVSTFIRPD